ncbi:Transcription factor IWS1 [Choanephora cucurbitarum]|uniref:Transcription factor IWS1 n=1 Tax=Choanephora cucurbitarum TaxID=101091 RepID=A0A1C7N3L3_9FUNG|nr:Transcription factor IWS1 [Choanephora cucurbitarum]
MASYDEDTVRQEKLFGSSEEEEEMSDLDGDQASDNEESYRVNTEYDDASEPVAEQQEETHVTTKLPSFKKKQRDVDAEENARLEEVRREIRELKNNTAPTDERIDDEQDEPIDPQQALRDEIDREFEKALRGGKKRRKRQDGEDLENSLDEELATLRENMRNASEEDSVANGERRPALAKLKMLTEASTMLTNKHLYDAILDNGLLDVIRLWLEPLPDRSLPSLDIQSEMLGVLDKLPISGDHLRESGVGKIVYFYSKSPRIEPAMKRKADQLVAKWSRMVIKRSENYKERRPVVQEYSQIDALHQRKRYKRPKEEPEDEKAQARHFVHVPQAVAADYDVAPQSTVRLDKNRNNKPDNTFRRLNNTMRSIKTGPKRTTPKVSIEGKGMSF